MKASNPQLYFITTVVLSAMAGGIVYSLYPVSSNSGYTIVKVEEGGAGLPGFMAGFKSVNAIKEPVTIEGTVYEHGFIYSGDERIHYMDIVDDAGRKVRVIIAPLAVEEEGVLKIVSQGRKIEMPLMMKHNIVVKGVELRNGLVVAEEIIVDMNWCHNGQEGMGHGSLPGPMGMHSGGGCSADS